MPTEEEKAAKARDAALQGALTQIERQFGKGTVMRMGDEGAQVRVNAIPTGALSLDLALGIGGVPRGRIVEVFGPESSGKTTLIYHVLAEAQKLGGVCAFIDAEHAMDPLYAREIGVDIDELLVSQPDYGEQGLEIADMLVRSGAVDVVAIDSVAALTPRAELEGQMGDQTVGLQARMMSQAMRKLAGNLNRTQTLCIFTNQIREKVGVMFGSPETQPGGRALKFYSSQRLDIRRIETLKEGTEAVGNRVRVKVVKNKVAAPFRQAEFDIEFGKGFSTSGCLIDLGIEHNVVTKSGSFFSYGDERLGQGRNNAKAVPRRARRGRQGDRGQDLRGAGHRSRPRPADRSRSRRSARRRAGRRSRRCRRPDRTGGVTDPERLQHALDLAYRFLGHRDRTVAEVRERLAAERVEPDVVDEAIEELRHLGYLDDARYAQRFAEDRRTIDAWGAERIERRLLAVGVDPELIAAALGDAGRRRGARGRPRRPAPALRAAAGATTASATARSACSCARATSSSSPTTRSAPSSATPPERHRPPNRSAWPPHGIGLRRPSRGTTIQPANDCPRGRRKTSKSAYFRYRQLQLRREHHESLTRASPPVDTHPLRTPPAHLKRGPRGRKPPSSWFHRPRGRSSAP